MSSGLIHICGPLAIHSFGLTIAIGLLIFLFLASRDPRRKAIMSQEQLYDILLIGIPLGLIGGRALYVAHDYDSFAHWSEWLHIWDGGVSSLGSIITLLIGIPAYLIYHSIPLLPTLDLISLYAPLIHFMVRIGCFLAGCCYGKATDSCFGIVAHGADSCIRTHPTQLYSAAALLLIFILLYFWIQKHTTKPGQLFCAYLMLTSLERFGIDFWRGDQEYFASPALSLFSAHQWLSLGLFVIASILMIYVSHNKRSTHTNS